LPILEARQENTKAAHFQHNGCLKNGSAAENVKMQNKLQFFINTYNF